MDNNQVINSVYSNNPTGGTAGQFYVGAAPGSATPVHFLDGGIYELRIWDSVVSQETLNSLLLDRPAPPTHLAAKAGPELDQITLNWTAPDANGEHGLTSYNVYRASALLGPYDQEATVASTSTSYTDSALAHGTTYYYRVTSANGNGESDFSNTALATTFSDGKGVMTMGDDAHDRPECYGAGFVGLPGSRCEVNPFGFSDDIVVTGVRLHTLTMDWGDFNRHGDVQCGSDDCVFQFEMDLRVVSPSQDFTPFNNQVVDVAQLERFDQATGMWTAVPGGVITGLLLAPDGSAEWGLHLPPRLVLTAEALGTGDGVSHLRLVAADRPGAPGEPWEFQFYAAKGELVAPPVIFAHGWPPFPYLDVSEYIDEQAGWDDAYAAEFEFQSVKQLGQNPWAWANDESFADLAFNGKDDFRISAILLYEEILRMRDNPAQGNPGMTYSGSVNLVVHSFGGLVSRYLVEDWLPRMDQIEGGTLYEPSALVSDIVTMGTPNTGSKWADAYIKGVDKAELAKSRFRLDSDHYYWDRNGNDIFRWLGPWHEAQDWWYDSVQAYRNWEKFSDDPHQSMMADFELTPVDGNPILSNLDVKYGAPGIHYFHAAGDFNPEVCKPSWLGGGCHQPSAGGKLGDFIVSLSSATRAFDSKACHNIYTDHAGRSAEFGWPLVGIASHDKLPNQIPIQRDAFAFMSGDKNGVCLNNPSFPGDSTNLAMSASSTLASSDADRLDVPVDDHLTFPAGNHSLRLTWVAPGNSNGTAYIFGVNETLSALNATLIAPDGANATLASGNKTWALWDGPTSLGGDGLLEISMPNATAGNWTFWLNTTGIPAGFLIPAVSFNTTLNLDVIEGFQGLVGQPTTYRIALTNESNSALGETVKVSFLDAASGGVQQIALVDDGSGADATAGDGEYTGQYTFSEPGAYGFRVNATIGSSKLTYAGRTAILNDPADATLTCGQMLLQANATLIQSITGLNPKFLAHCALEGNPSQLIDSAIALIEEKLAETEP